MMIDRSSSSSRAGSSGGGSSTQACAACKYQRRKCAPDCILAPYFPHDRQRQFLNAHKLFGVSNITKIIKNLSPNDKDIAMRTIIFQSDARATDPVGGCFSIIRHLQRQLDYHQAELDLVNHHLALCHAHHNHNHSPHPNPHDPFVYDHQDQTTTLLQQQSSYLQPANHFNINAAALHGHESSTTAALSSQDSNNEDVKPVISDIDTHDHDNINNINNYVEQQHQAAAAADPTTTDHPHFIQQTRFAPSTQLLISSS